MQDQKEEKKTEEKSTSIKLTAEQNKKLDFFITAPLRSADRLMKQLYNNDHFYETTTYAWVGEKDAKKLFLYGVCKEVIKSCIGLTNDKEFLQEVPNHKEKKPDRMEKIISGGITDAQTYRIRKMVELLGFLILFDRNTKRDEEYRVFLSAENLDLALARQEDFRELYEGRIISNTKHSIDDYAKRIQDDLKTLGVQELWFLHKDRLKNLKPSVFASKKKLFLAALLVASADERLALGISYGRGYSRTSQSVHPLLGSHDYGKDDNNTKHIISNFSYLSIICMHIMHLAYKLAGVDDPEGITKMMGENFEKSEASKNIAQFKKEFEVGDLVLTAWTDLAEIVEEHTSKYGYKAYKIKYLLRPPLPEFPEDWVESSNILARLMTKSWARSFLEKNTSMDKMPQEVKDIWPEVMKQSDEELMKSVMHFFVDMHKHGILIPMLTESGFLKKREEAVW
ncbi:MAG: hypothetical protein Q8P52_00675 [bacterium]|nr:hypothetical protein [bacterium]